MTDIKRVSPQEALALQQEGYAHIDVRTPEEWAAGHPKGAPNVPWALAASGGMTPNPDFVAAMTALYAKDAKLVVDCRSGGRSLKAANALVAAGFSNVIDQRAGYEGPRDAFGQITEKGWAAAGLPTETETSGGSWAEQKAKSGI